MSTVAEIVDAVKQLSAEQKRELFAQLESVLVPSVSSRAPDSAADPFSPEFTRRLIEHFHGAKRAALSQS
jgi:hypothetical protein